MKIADVVSLCQVNPAYVEKWAEEGKREILRQRANDDADNFGALYSSEKLRSELQEILVDELGAKLRSAAMNIRAAFSVNAKISARNAGLQSRLSIEHESRLLAVARLRRVEADVRSISATIERERDVNLQEINDERVRTNSARIKNLFNFNAADSFTKWVFFAQSPALGLKKFDRLALVARIRKGAIDETYSKLDADTRQVVDGHPGLSLYKNVAKEVSMGIADGDRSKGIVKALYNFPKVKPERGNPAEYLDGDRERIEAYGLRDAYSQAFWTGETY